MELRQGILSRKLFQCILSVIQCRWLPFSGVQVITQYTYAIRTLC